MDTSAPKVLLFSSFINPPSLGGGTLARLCCVDQYKTSIEQATSVIPRFIRGIQCIMCCAATLKYITEANTYGVHIFRLDPANKSRDDRRRLHGSTQQSLLAMTSTFPTTYACCSSEVNIVVGPRNKKPRSLSAF